MDKPAKHMPDLSCSRNTAFSTLHCFAPFKSSMLWIGIHTNCPDLLGQSNFPVGYATIALTGCSVVTNRLIATGLEQQKTPHCPTHHLIYFPLPNVEEVWPWKGVFWRKSRLEGARILSRLGHHKTEIQQWSVVYVVVSTLKGQWSNFRV